MYSLGDSWEPAQDWEQVRDSLTETDTDSVKNQLEHMDSAEITYPKADSGTKEIEQDFADYYDNLIEFNTTDEDPTQYMELGGKDLKVAVEKDEELIFYIEAYEETGMKIPGLNLGLGATT